MIIVSDNYVQHPKVSVVILTYNQENFIAQAIESIVCQETTFPYEIIIGEDCSTDTTRDICLSYQNKYPQLIKVISQEKNLGVIGNYKSVLNQCRGEYIAECGGDDYWCDENKLQKHIDYMDEHDDVVVTYHDVKTVDKFDKILNQSYLTDDSKMNFSEQSLKECAWILPQTMCFRAKMRDSFVKELNKNVKNEDTFITSIMGTFGSGVYLPEIHSTAYRQSPSGIWSMQNRSHKNLMKISTYRELQRFYKKRRDIDLVNFFRVRISTFFADTQDSVINCQDKVWYITLIVKNICNIGVKNFLHYIKKTLF